MVLNETNFPHKLLLTDTYVLRLQKAFFTKGSSTNIKLSKTQLSKRVQLGGFITFTLPLAGNRENS